MIVEQISQWIAGYEGWAVAYLVVYVACVFGLTVKVAEKRALEDVDGTLWYAIAGLLILFAPLFWPIFLLMQLARALLRGFGL